MEIKNSGRIDSVVHVARWKPSVNAGVPVQKRLHSSAITVVVVWLLRNI
jgi:hypothetical protein